MLVSSIAKGLIPQQFPDENADHVDDCASTLLWDFPGNAEFEQFEADHRRSLLSVLQQTTRVMVRVESHRTHVSALTRFAAA